MGKCLSQDAPTDYGELSGGKNTQTPGDDIGADVGKSNKAIKTRKSPNITNGISSPQKNNKRYRKISTESKSVQDFDIDVNNDIIDVNDGYNIVEIDENIIIDDLVKIYDHKKECYIHYGLLLNQKHCKLYLINPLFF